MRVRVCVCVFVFVCALKWREKKWGESVDSLSLCCWFPLFNVLFEDEFFFFLQILKVHAGRKYLPLFLRLSFEIIRKVWLSSENSHAQHTHTHFKHETVRSLLLLFLRRRIGAHTLSLSFLFLQQFFSICSFTRRRHTENYIYIWIKAKTFL